MISLELAKKLNDAGLKWDPKEGDFSDYDGKIELVTEENIKSTKRLLTAISRSNGLHDDMLPILLPSLSQLLAEVERRGWGWDLDNMNVPSDPMYNLGLFSGDYGEFVRAFFGDTQEDAAGQALLWILEQEVSQ